MSASESSPASMNQMWICRNCKIEIPSQAAKSMGLNFCPRCGKPVSSEAGVEEEQLEGLERSQIEVNEKRGEEKVVGSQQSGSNAEEDFELIGLECKKAPSRDVNAECPDKPTDDQQAQEKVHQETTFSSDLPLQEHATPHNVSRKRQPENVQYSRGKVLHNVTFDGLQAPRSRAIKLIFHVIVPKTLWELDEYSSIHIQFGHKNLGYWENCGKFYESRIISKSWSIMSCTFESFEKRLLDESDRHPVPYKYVISSPRSQMKPEEHYEYLHIFTGPGDYNRCLFMDLSKGMKPIQGVYNQYDTIAYPKHVMENQKEVGSVGAIGDAIGEFLMRMLPLRTDHDELQYNALAMSRCCLPIYLNEFALKISAGTLDETFKINDYYCEIHHILHCVSTINGMQSRSHRMGSKQNLEKLKETFFEWLEKLIGQSFGKSSTPVSVAVFIIYCFGKEFPGNWTFKLKTGQLTTLLSMLALKPNNESRSCTEWDLLQAQIPENYRKSACHHVGKLCKRFADCDDKYNFHYFEWFSALPVYHFLSGKSKPFQETKIDWSLKQRTPESASVGVFEVQRKAVNDSRFFYDLYRCLKEMFTLDPLLLKIFIECCPLKVYAHLCQEIHPSLCMRWFSYHVKQPDVLQSLPTDENLSDWCHAICSVESALKDNDLKNLETGEASLRLCTSMFEHLTNCHSQTLKVLCASISLMLCAFPESCLKEPNVNRFKIKQILLSWIEDSSVIGNKRFGGFGRHWLGLTELKVWQSFLSVNPEYKPWQGILKEIIEERIRRIVKLQQKVELFCEMENMSEDIHSVLADLIIEAAMDAISNKDYGQQSFNTIAKIDPSDRVSKLLRKILVKHFNAVDDISQVEEVDTQDLLSWSLWPNFIRIIAKEARHEEFLKEECWTVCVCAQSRLCQVCTGIQRSNITIADIKHVRKHRNQMDQLCEENLPNKSSKDEIKTAIQHRLKELEVFEKMMKQLRHLRSQIDVDLQCVSTLDGIIDKNYDDCEIGSVCQITSSGEITLSCIESLGAMTLCLQTFYNLSCTYSTAVFRKKWACQLSEIHNGNPELAFNDIYNLVWLVCFNHFQTLLDELKSLQIKLTDIDEHFGDYKDCIDTELLKLHNGVFTRADKETPDCLRIAINKCKEYWRLCQNCDIANVILQLRDFLRLTGDFSLVEKLSQQLTVSSQQEKLADIDDSIVQAEVFLQEISRDPEGKLRCLNLFVESQKLVDWLRSISTDVSQLQNFVNIAMATTTLADDVVCDKLSTLRTVGGAFGSLIYNLNQDEGYKTLCTRCKLLWRALDNNRSLPKLLKSCNEYLESFKYIKEMQGSVETTAYGQLHKLLKHGQYRIGTTRHNEMTSINTLISVSFPDELDQQVRRRDYNLDELRDLQSKLVLIAGNRPEYRQEVDLFVDVLHYIIRIAEVLVELRRAGNIKYSVWVLQFVCTVYEGDVRDVKAEVIFKEELAEKLKHQLHHCAQVMEYERNEWKCVVENARTKFYELNNFRTVELHHLRKDLGKLKTCSASVIMPDTLTVLQRISPDVTQVSIQRFVSSVIAERSGYKKNVPFGQMEVQGITKSTEEESVQTSDDEAIGESVCVTADPNETAIRSLTTDQHNILTTVRNTFGYPESFVLQAFRSVGDTASLTDIELWCSENFVKQVQGSEIESGLNFDSDDADSESSSSDESNSKDQQHVPRDSRFQTEKETPIVRDEIVRKQVIDENHPMVMELVNDLKFTLEDSLETVKRYDTIQLCVTYLSKDKEERGQMPPQRKEQTKAEDIMILCDCEAEERFLSLDELGTVLQRISKDLPSPVPSPRTFETDYTPGEPNLVVIKSECILQVALLLYVNDKSLPLPSQDEVLICNQYTTEEEVTLLWRRSLGDPQFHRIFCLVHADRLSYQVSDKVLRSFVDLSQGSRGYRLVIICSKEMEDTSLFVSKFHLYKRPMVLNFATGTLRHMLQKYLSNHFISQAAECSNDNKDNGASQVDSQKSCVRLVTSDRAGMGKSLYIKTMANQLSTRLNCKMEEVYVKVPVHGPNVSSKSLLDILTNLSLPDMKCKIIHIDFSPTIRNDISILLFQLLILRGLTDDLGRVWRCHPSQYYAVELTLPDQKQKTTVSQNREVLHLFPLVKCSSPKLANAGQSPEIDIEQFNSARFQRVYQYLKRYMKGEDLDSFTFQKDKIEGNRVDCLKRILWNCGVKDPSWSEIHDFVTFLNEQLFCCEESAFCNEVKIESCSAISDAIGSGFKTFVLRFMMRMSLDFATATLKGEVAQENEVEIIDKDLEAYQVAKQWEHSSHPYIFFNHDQDSLTFVGFRATRVSGGPSWSIVDSNGILIEERILNDHLYQLLKINKVDFNTDHKMLTKRQLIIQLARVIGIKSYSDPDRSYVLTADNLIKMLAIQMRFRCGIPVIIIGETGCGKTRLIRYMCSLGNTDKTQSNMLIMKIHGGVTEKHIASFVQQAEKLAKTNAQHNKLTNNYTVAFFDEANTTDAIGLIKEILCDRCVNGRPIRTDNLKFVAACNPYRKHSRDMIRKLETAGLGFFRETETEEKLGKVPLRQLVYRVLELPPRMKSLVYDFGQLDSHTEYQYIHNIVRHHVTSYKLHSHMVNIGELKHGPTELIKSVTDVLAHSQNYMRERKDECSFVSLRDVERAMIVFRYFLTTMKVIGPLVNEKAMRKKSIKLLDTTTRALVLAISICYHARLQKRTDYEEVIAGVFQKPLYLPGKDKQFRNEIRWCQEVFLDAMVIGPNIAKNEALRENVFMMAVCIQLRIPLFLIGKPGSSKSLAKSIIQNSMHGTASTTDLLRSLKPIHMIAYQCSQLSTPESIIEVFNQATMVQKNSNSECISVVVLDEVGLAEDSPGLPLKALHPLLEDGTDNAKTGDSDDHSFKDMIIRREDRVAFVGISNWALDPAKMNRGIMVTRGDPDVKELEFSANGICTKEQVTLQEQAKDDTVKHRLKEFFKPLAQAYLEICEKQSVNFFGLRDFYSLIKMLYWMCDKSEGRALTWPQLEYSIRRNFGGLETSEMKPLTIFKKALPFSEETLDITEIPEDLQPFVNPDCSELGLIKTSLNTTGENRYLLFLTENYVALGILERYLLDTNKISAESQNGATCDKPLILFGSSFPKDKEYTLICKNINQIKICMETGRTVILLNLDYLYESLYDLLNQNYLYFAESRYVDLGLGIGHRVKCRVHPDFKLVLIAEKDTVYKKFPTPLINRLEKHFVLTSTVLNLWQQNILQDFGKWITSFCNCTDRYQSGVKFSESDAFIGYQKDTPASIVLEASNKLIQPEEQPDDPTAIKMVEDTGILTDLGINFAQLRAMKHDSSTFEDAVLRLSQYLILQTSSDDSLIRLQNTALADQQEELMKVYYRRQHHNSAQEFLKYHLRSDGFNGIGQLLQITTHGQLLTSEEIEDMRSCISESMNITPFLLQEFDTEANFSKRIHSIFQRTEDNLIVIQCDSGHKFSDLIACSRYLIYEERVKVIAEDKRGKTHVLFVINLPCHVTGSPFVSFQGDPWICAHIDELKHKTAVTPDPYEALHTSISEMFVGQNTPVEQQSCDRSLDSDAAVSTKDYMYHDHQPQYERLHGCIQAAVSKLKDNTKHRNNQRVKILLNLIPHEFAQPLNMYSTFYGALVKHIFRLLKERDETWVQDEHWVLNEAMNAKHLRNGGTFRNVLARKIDQVVVPFFAEIISGVDNYYNLNLIDSSNEESALSQFWIAMFRDPEIMQWSYTDITVQVVPAISQMEFKCKLPFCWIIQDVVDSQAQWKAQSSDLVNKKDMYSQLCGSVEHTPVGEVMKSVNEMNCEPFYSRYLKDFVRLSHKCKHKLKDTETKEYELIGRALNRMVHAPMFATLDGKVSLIQRIVALHLVYKECKPQIMLFSQLISHHPGIMSQVETNMKLHPPDNMEMEIQLYAVEVLLTTDLDPPIKKPEPINCLKLWLKHVRLTSNTINSILSFPSQSERTQKARLDWNRICAMQLFVEHILLEHPETKLIQHYASRLDMFWRRDCDFLQASTIQTVKMLLVSMEREVQPLKLKVECDKFFLELVSSLSFGKHSLPEDKLIKDLMDVVIKSRKTKKRIFLLHLLMEHNMENARMLLQSYFSSHQQPLDGNEMDKTLCLLCVQCFEDKWHQKFSAHTVEGRKQTMATFIHEGHSALKHYCDQNSVSLQYIEGVAKLRVSLSAFAEVLCITTKKQEGRDSLQHVELIDSCKVLCTDNTVNCVNVDNPSGPSVYLLKVLVQQYGLPTLNSVAREYPWIIPTELSESKHEMLDPFVIYCKQYTDIRDAISHAVCFNDMQKLRDITQSIQHESTTFLMLALYEKVTLSHADTLKSQKIVLEVLQSLISVIQSTDNLSPDMKLMAMALVSNQQGNTLAQMCITPQLPEHCRTLVGIVIHTAAVLYSRHTMEILLPFTNMLNNPVALNGSYLPTMHDDFLEEVEDVLRESDKSYKTGRFFQCVNGHRYFIGNCGNPTEKSICNVCGSEIGGVGNVYNKLIEGNKPVECRDTTITGHDLGRPQERTSMAASERGLSPASICILRALMHSAFVWNCCRNESVLESIAHLVHANPPINPNELAEFFWKHLETDIEQLGKATGKGFDESVMIVHLVLRNVLNRHLPGGTLAESISSLSTKQEREKWEHIFNQHFIQPLVSDLDASLSQTMDRIVQDTETDHAMLLHIAYEKVSVPKGKTEPHLWTYRSRVSLEHLCRTLQENKRIKEKHAILYEFMQAEPILRAAKYLPDIIKLQLSLHQRFHYRFDKSDAKKLTIKTFLDSIKTVHERDKYHKWINSLMKAWKLVGYQLDSHRRLPVEKKFLVKEITESTSLVYVIPTTSDEGACTTALVDFLVLAQNSLVERCRGIISEDQSWTPLLWHKQSILLTHVQLCHLIDHGKQILSIIQSHSDYSLEFGKGRNVQYNYKSLEKHIFDRFIYGKPLIEISDIPQVLYRKDICTAVTFAAIRKKVNPQEPLSLRIQQDIIRELHNNPARISETLDIVDIVLGFLSSGGGKASRNLGDYIDKILRIQPDVQFSEKAKECSLGNILSLWLTLSVERARQFYLHDESPFESIPKIFLRSLSENEGGVNQATELKKCLPSFDIEMLLNNLYELIETYIKYAAEHQADWTIMETLESLSWSHMPFFSEKFPTSITIDQAVDAWKHIVIYQQEI